MKHTHTEMRAVDELSVADKLQLAEDVRLFRVMSIERKGAPEARRKVNLRSSDGATRLTLLRRGSALVEVCVDDGEDPPA